MMSLFRAILIASRALRRTPGFSAVAILTLAIGIAANTAIFSVVHATLLAPLPYAHADELVMIWSKLQARNPTSTGDFLEWKRHSTSFQDLHAWTARSVSDSTTGQPEQLLATAQTPGFHTMVGERFVMGRDFLPEEGEPGRDNAVILTHSLWQERYGGDANILGRTLRIDGHPHTVVGVLAPGPNDRTQSRLTLPLAFAPDQINHDARWLRVVGRLKPGLTLERANAEMQAISRRIAEIHPVSNKGWTALVEPLRDSFVSDNTRAALWMLLGAVAFVLLIACANIANLLLARGTTRQREVAVRTAMGATRGRLIVHFLAESVLLAVLGGALGILLARVMLDAILAMMPSYTLPSVARVGLNSTVLLFTLGVSVCAGLLFGSLPAWQVTRANLNGMLREAGRGAVGSSRNRLGRAFVVAEFALALTLLGAGGLAISSVAKLASVDLGFRTDGLLTFSLPAPNTRFQSPEEITTFYEQLLEKMRSVPSVTSVSASTGMPVHGTGFGMRFSVAGQPAVDPSQRRGAGFNMVTPEYYKTFGITLASGRTFTEQDSAKGLRVAVVNETFVKRFLPDLDPLKQRIVIEQLIPGSRTLGPPVEWQIVGVHRDIRNGGPRGGEFPEIDVPFAQSPWPGTFMAVRTTGDPDRVRNSLAAIVQGMDADLAMANVRTMDQVVDEALGGDRFQAMLFGGFAAIALVLAALGIYGVMSFAVAQRTHEIGLRMALGADRTQVLWQIVREGMITVGAGMLLGTIGAYVAGRAMRGLWFGVGAIDPLAFGVVVVLLLLSAVIACLVPAHRAASVDPLIALRDQ